MSILDLPGSNYYIVLCYSIQERRIGMKSGVQIYSLRDVAKADLDEALRILNRLGCKVIEFAGFYGHTAECLVHFGI